MRQRRLGELDGEAIWPIVVIGIGLSILHRTLGHPRLDPDR